MDRLLLIRHAAVEIEAGIASRKWRLSANGRTQSRRLARQLPLPRRIFTSVEPKAQETGRIIAETMGVSWTSVPDLHEHDRTGVAYLPSKADFEARAAEFFRKPDDLVFGGETATQTLDRFSGAIARLGTEEGLTAVVAHGTVITLFVCRHNPDLDPMIFWRRLTLPCAFHLDSAHQIVQRIE